MRNVEKINVEIVRGSPSIKLEAHFNGKTTIKHTTADSLTAAIAQNIDFNTGILPKGTRYYSGSPSDYNILIETAPMLKVINLYSSAKRDKDSSYSGHNDSVPFPHLLFHFRVAQYKVVNSHIFALKKSLKNLGDQLYIFPYGNVYTNGNVCWGSALKSKKINNPMNVVDVIARFLDSQYNADLFDSHVINVKKLEDFGNNLSFWKFVEYMKKRKIFPVEALNHADVQLSSIL